MKIAILSALGNVEVRACVDSLLATAGSADFDLLVLRERGIRERTLNAALEQLGTDDDLLLVGEDIRFTPGWLEALRAQEEQADIWGMSMLYPDSDKVQDRGYDLIETHGRVQLEARERGRRRGELEPFGWRRCDGVCGCFVYLRRRVFQWVRTFREEEGCNRWGESVFLAEARRHGARIAVLDHFLEHGGVSTKGHADPRYGSLSYRLERELWQRLADRFIDPAWVRQHRRTAFDTATLEQLRRPGQRVLIYGIGTVTEALLYHLGEVPSGFVFASGLPEEAGLEIAGRTVQDVRRLDPADFDWIVLTPLHAGEKIYRQHFAANRPPEKGCRVSMVTAEPVGAVLQYRLLPPAREQEPS